MENQENTTIIERKYCEKCGAKNSLDNDFCFYCGNVLKKENITIIEDSTVQKNIEKNNIDSSYSLNNENTLTKENEENSIATENNCCSQCGTKNDINNGFCFHCGNALKKQNLPNTLIGENNFCKICGTQNNINNKFCIKCGNELQKENQEKIDLVEQKNDEKKEPTKKNIFMKLIGIIALLPFFVSNIIGIATLIILIIVYLLCPNKRNIYHIILNVIGIFFTTGTILFLILLGTCFMILNQ